MLLSCCVLWIYLSVILDVTVLCMEVLREYLVEFSRPKGFPAITATLSADTISNQRSSPAVVRKIYKGFWYAVPKNTSSPGECEISCGIMIYGLLISHVCRDSTGKAHIKFCDGFNSVRCRTYPWISNRNWTSVSTCRSRARDLLVGYYFVVVLSRSLRTEINRPVANALVVFG